MLYTNCFIGRDDPILDDFLIGGLQAGFYKELVYDGEKITRGNKEGSIFAILYGEGNDFSQPFARLKKGHGPEVLKRGDHHIILEAHPGDYVRARVSKSTQIIKFEENDTKSASVEFAERIFGKPLPFGLKNLGGKKALNECDEWLPL